MINKNMSKKTFDELCASYLGENVPPSPAAPKLVTTPSPNQPAQPNANPQPTPAPSNQQMGDDELMKLLQQKLLDTKFKQQLAQMLANPAQPNAANQPTP